MTRRHPGHGAALDSGPMTAIGAHARPMNDDAIVMVVPGHEPFGKPAVVRRRRAGSRGGMVGSPLSR